MELNDIDIFVFAHKAFETERTNPAYKIVCSDKDDVESDKLQVIKLNCELSNIGFSEWQKIYEIYKGNAGNLKKYVGIAHFHRYIKFSDDVNYLPDFDKEFENIDCMTLDLLDVGSVFQQYAACHNASDYLICGKIIKEGYNDYYDSFLTVSKGRWLSACNIVIMKREDFLKMCEFVFGVLFDYCEVVGIDRTSDESFIDFIKDKPEYHKFHKKDDFNYREQARIPAFLAERLVTIFMWKNFNNLKMYPITEV